MLTVETPWRREDSPRADGMVTDRPGIALGVLAADCAPILFADPQAGVIGAAHGGWRGALDGVAEATVAAMAALGRPGRPHPRRRSGPCIGQDSYEVGPEFPPRFAAVDAGSAGFLRAGARAPAISASICGGYIEHRLGRLGLAAVERAPHDTVAEPERFFSYRRACLTRRTRLRPRAWRRSRLTDRARAMPYLILFVAACLLGSPRHLRAGAVTRRRGSGVIWRIGARRALAACQPLPHPFADDRPPAALLRVPGSMDITVGNFDGEPRATAVKLSAAIAGQLLKHDITASATAASHSGYTLDGRIEEGPPQAGKATVTVFWQLHDPAGKIVTEHRTQLAGPVRDWEQGADAQVDLLAAAGADVLASLITETTPKEQRASGRVRVAVHKLTGAPGDGNDSLAASMTAVLKQADIDLVDATAGKPDLDVDGAVSIETKGAQQHVKIVWRVSRAGGAEIGTVGQENDLPRGRLDGAVGRYRLQRRARRGRRDHATRRPWRAAAEARRDRRHRGPASGCNAGTARRAGLPPVAPNSPPAPGNIASPAVNLPPVNVNSDTQPDAPVLLPKRGVYLPR